MMIDVDGRRQDGRDGEETLRDWLEPRVRAKQLAAAGGFSQSYVWAVADGKRPSQRFIEAACALGIPKSIFDTRTGS